jgi:ribosomal protein S24E
VQTNELIGPDAVASPKREVYVVEHIDKKLPMRIFLSRKLAEMYSGQHRVVIYSPKDGQ